MDKEQTISRSGRELPNPNVKMGPAEASSLPNPFDPSFWGDPYSYYPSLLAGPPRPLPLLLPTFLVARHCDVVNVLRDYELFSSRSSQLFRLAKLDPFAGAQTMLLSDPPVHTRLRRLVTPYFRPGRINFLASRIGTLTNHLLDNIESRAEFDVVSDLASPLTLAITAEVLGIPMEHQPMLKAWSDQVFQSVRESLMLTGVFLTGRLDMSGSNGTTGRHDFFPIPRHRVLGPFQRGCYRGSAQLLHRGDLTTPLQSRRRSRKCFGISTG